MLPGSGDKPILGIQAMRDMDLVGKYPHLFRTADALARRPPPIASESDRVAGVINPDFLRVIQADPQGKLGVPEAMKSRCILKVGKRRVDGRSTPITTGTHRRGLVGGK